MSEEEIGVKERLLASGKEEFLQNGFRNASLRRICAKAGVTTGALYFFFQNKEELFCTIVEKPMSQYEEIIGKTIQREWEDRSTAIENEEQIIRFLLRYKDEYILLIEKSEGTRYAGFFEQYKSRLEEVFISFFEKYAPGRAQPELIKLIVEMRIQGYMELLKGNYTLEETIKLTKYMAYYADAGFAGLIEQLNKEGN